MLAALVALAVIVASFALRGGGGSHAPAPDPPGRPISGWFPYWVGEWGPETTSFDAHQAYVDAVSPFWYQAGQSGSTPS